MTCRFFPHERDIVAVVGEHVDPCAKHWMPELDGQCAGCWPCPVPAVQHCGLCAAHLDVGDLGTCPACRGRVRADLYAVLELAALLPDQALAAARDGHLAASADPPGYDALVLMSRGSEGLSETEDDSLGDLLPPNALLAWWEETWREAQHLSSMPPSWHGRPAAVLVRAFRYLIGPAFDWAAAHHTGFAWFAADIRRARAQLEDVLHAGDRPAQGVPCFLCGTTLTRAYRDPRRCDCGPRPNPSHVRSHSDTSVCCLGCAALTRWELRHADHDQGGAASDDPLDDWACPRCHRVYDKGEYQLAITVLHSAHARALPASELGDRLGLEPSLVWQWARRGHVRKRGRASDGRTLYDVADAVRHAAKRTIATEAETGVS